MILSTQNAFSTRNLKRSNFELKITENFFYLQTYSQTLAFPVE